MELFTCVIACIAVLLTSWYPSSALVLRSISKDTQQRHVDAKTGGKLGILATPTHTRTVRLQSKTGYFLQVPFKGHPRGTRNVSDEFTTLQMEAIGSSKVRLRGRISGAYFAMDRNGVPYISANATDECIFIERLGRNSFHTFASQKYSGPKYGNYTSEWYLAIKKSGKFKHGPNTAKGHRSAQFTVIPIDRR